MVTNGADDISLKQQIQQSRYKKQTHMGKQNLPPT